MTNRYADDIKRIVGIDPNQSALGDATARDSIGRGRGIGTGFGSSARSVSGTAGQTQLGSSTSGDTDSGAQSSGTRPLSPDNISDNSYNTTDGIVDVEGIIDGTLDQSKTQSAIIGPDGLIYDHTGALNGFTAVDCNTGTDVEVRFRNDFPPPDATYDDNGNQITEEWTLPDVAPTLLGFSSGTQWGTGIGPTGPYFTTAMGVANNLNQTVSGGGNTITASFWKSGSDAYNGGTWRIEYYPTGFPGSPTVLETLVSSQGCTADDADSTCPITAPTEQYWPSDDKVSLKYEGGSFQGSEFDEDRPLENANPAGQIDFCFGSGGSRTGTIEPTHSGGFIIYETSAGTPTGTARIYDTSGQLVGAVDAANKGAYTPTN